MHRQRFLLGSRCVATLSIAVVATAMLARSSPAQQVDRPAYVIVERLTTTGSESIQEQYAQLARDILPKYGARYLARSQSNTLLEGNGPAPCCMAILQFPNLETAKRWYNSPENQAAAKVRQSGATFRLVMIEGSPAKP